MATIHCPHCNVSLDGEAEPGDEIECPSCGNTFVMPAPARKKFTVSAANAKPVQTIQKTSKKYKICTIIGWLFAIPALVLFLLAYNQMSIPLLIAGAVLFVIGLAFALYAKIGAWWTNG